MSATNRETLLAEAMDRLAPAWREHGCVPEFCREHHALEVEALKWAQWAERLIQRAVDVALEDVAIRRNRTRDEAKQEISEIGKTVLSARAAGLNEAFEAIRERHPA